MCVWGVGGGVPNCLTIDATTQNTELVKEKFMSNRQAVYERGWAIK